MSNLKTQKLINMTMPAENLNSNLLLAITSKIVCPYCNNLLGKKLVLENRTEVYKCCRCGKKWVKSGDTTYGL